MREIVLDTETTGLNPKAGHRVVEIGCIELIDRVPTGRTFHQYINPERDMPKEAFAVHGLSEEFLSQHPVFALVGDDFLGFVEDAQLIIHNAEFDLRFLNAELEWIQRPGLQSNPVVDTVFLARRKFPGAPANLDALCKRFQIDSTKRTKHGALVDCELLTEVYIELLGGRQRGFVFDMASTSQSVPQDLTHSPTEVLSFSKGAAKPPRSHQPSDEELTAHKNLLEKLNSPLWGL